MTIDPAEQARAAANTAARASYGRLIAYLSARTRDIAGAEDALGEAFAAAIDHWVSDGVPANPEAWLLTAARRKLIDASRRATIRHSGKNEIALAIEDAAALAAGDRFVDERLKLLFICAHPAIGERARTPLMLQTVLGLDAARIASAFLVSPSSMAQRLVRAKRKISEARIPFVEPEPEDLQARADAVLDAIYAAFGAGFDEQGSDDGGADLSREAIYLADLAAGLLPANAEAHGLAAQMAFVEARRTARRVDGNYVPLDAQDTAHWDRQLISKAEASLAQAAAINAVGRYQLEAAIQSAHVNARLSGVDVRDAVVRLYERLLATAPSIGAVIAKAGALLKAGRGPEALATLDALDAAVVAAHQPYWATRAHALAEASRTPEAAAAFDRAIGLSSDAGTRRFLSGAKARLTD
ncbi:MAG: RNA polymerase sigma factor [Parvularculaceae bacterium]